MLGKLTLGAGRKEVCCSMWVSNLSDCNWGWTFFGPWWTRCWPTFIARSVLCTLTSWFMTRLSSLHESLSVLKRVARAGLKLHPQKLDRGPCFWDTDWGTGVLPPWTTKLRLWEIGRPPKLRRSLWGGSPYMQGSEQHLLHFREHLWRPRSHIVGSGVVLTQVLAKEERVVEYHSRTLSKAECRYCVARRELLSVVSAIQHFMYYLEGLHFTMRTDQPTLQWLMSARETEGHLMCWIEELQVHDFTMVHRPCIKHGNADALSHQPCVADDDCSHLWILPNRVRAATPCQYFNECLRNNALHGKRLACALEPQREYGQCLRAWGWRLSKALTPTEGVAGPSNSCSPWAKMQRCCFSWNSRVVTLWCWQNTVLPSLGLLLGPAQTKCGGLLSALWWMHSSQGPSRQVTSPASTVWRLLTNGKNGDWCAGTISPPREG